MEYFLCGGGFGIQVKEIFNRYIGNQANILYIPIAMTSDKLDKCQEWFRNEISSYNAKFYMIKSFEDIEKIDILSFSHIFIGGGNTYKLLKELRNANFFNITKKFNGKIWGGSAGAIVFGKDINSCKNVDDNIVNLKHTEGANIINHYSLICHLNEENFKKNKEYLEEYSIRYKTIFISEENVIYKNGKNFKIMGDAPYIIFDQGQYKIYNNKYNWT